MYNYQTERPYVFTDEGQRKTMAIFNHARYAIKIAGCVRAEKLIAAAGSGDSWSIMACIDRLVELGELQEIPIVNVPGQYRIFINTRES